MNTLFLRRYFFLALCFLLVGALNVSPTLAQSEEMAVADKVSDLEEQLSSTSIDKRDEAEKEIIAFGSKALDFLGDPSPDLEDDLNARLTRIRKALEKVAIDEAVTPSKITLSGEMTIQEALEQIKSQSGNIIEMAEGYDLSLIHI